MNSLDELGDRFFGLTEELTLLRKDLHRIPETALEEHKTGERILREIASLPLDMHKPYIGTDIVADLTPSCPWTETVILRADMDGLNITEEGEQEWKSTHSGKMHACGHDGHMAILTGAARVLCGLRDNLSKRVRFVFQPGEEMRCAGRMLAERGAYEGCTESYALHGWPGLEEGQIRTRKGVILAATDTFSFTFTGRGIHGATPEEGVNPLPAAARFILQAEKLHKEVNRSNGSVISTCIVTGGSSANIIPDRCRVEGTTRYLSREQGNYLVNALKDLAREASDQSGTAEEDHFDRLYDLPVINDAGAAEKVLSTATRLFGEAAVSVAARPDMMAEDFAFCLEKAPGCFFQLGLGRDWAPLHTSRFDFNDRAISRGVLLFTALAGGFHGPIR